MKSFHLLLCLAFATAPCLRTHATASDTESADRIVEASMAAMGGRALLESIHGVALHANVERNLLEQSIRPEGPWIRDQYQLEMTLDFAGARLHAIEQRSMQPGWLAPPPIPAPPVEYVVVDGVAAARADGAFDRYRQSVVQDADDLLALNPLRVLLTARNAPNLRRQADVVRHGMRHYVLAWTRGGSRTRLYVNAATRLPAAVAWTAPHPRDVFWNAWGDVDHQFGFENWSLQPNRLRVPTQWTFQRNGLPDSAWEIGALALNAGVEAAAWQIPEALREQATRTPGVIDDLPLGLPDAPAVVLAPGIVRIPGRWDVTLVRQQDGVVVIEAPIGNGYSARVLDEAHRRFPGVPVKAVVSTSDAWPHIAGLREYVARGVPVHVLDLNRPVVERLLAAPHAARPDALQRQPRAAVLQEVSEAATLGSGANRIVLVPLRTATGERQMLAWLPGVALMYTSDLVQPMGGGGWFAPEMLLELQQRFDSAGFRPAGCFGMHYGVTPWADMQEALARHLEGPHAGR